MPSEIEHISVRIYNERVNQASGNIIDRELITDKTGYINSLSVTRHEPACFGDIFNASSVASIVASIVAGIVAGIAASIVVSIVAGRFAVDFLW